jgi:SAM-dependent methyltransferase
MSGRAPEQVAVVDGSRRKLPDAPLKTQKCLICGEEALAVGSARLDDTMVEKMSNHVAIGPMYRIARDAFDYHEQFLYACRSCGMVFVWPVLSDEDTTRLMFDVIGTEWAPSKDWSYPEMHFETLPVWYSAVRIPSLNRSLAGLLPDQPILLLDIGGHNGEISLNMALPAGSQVDITQLENDQVIVDPALSRVESIRTFNGLTNQFVEAFPDYRADLVLASNVLEHTDDPNSFLQDCRSVLADDGLLVVEVPYEPGDAADLAFNLNFQLAHHLYFFPWTITQALERNGFEILRFEVLPHAHTGVIPSPSTQMRAICRKTTKAPIRPEGDLFALSLDVLMGSFGASLAFVGGVDFIVFVFDPATQPLLDILRTAPGFKGVVTTNTALDYPDLLSDPPIDARYVIIPKSQDRHVIQKYYRGRFEVV